MENHEDCFHQTLTGKERMKIKQALQEPMNAYNIMSLHAHPEWRIPAARWFQEKWEIPLEEYLTSIRGHRRENHRTTIRLHSL